MVSKYNTNFQDILNLDKKRIEKIITKINKNEESKKHITIWKIEKKNQVQAKINILNIYEKIKEKKFKLLKENCYILLVIEKKIEPEKMSNLKLKLKFPNSLTSLLNSFENLTERGLSMPFCVSSYKNLFSFKIYLLNGKNTNNELKSLGVVSALKLEDWLIKNNSMSLMFLYFGFYLTEGKISNGNRINLISNRNYSKIDLNLSLVSLAFITQILGIQDYKKNYTKQNIFDVFFKDKNLNENKLIKKSLDKKKKMINSITPKKNSRKTKFILPNFSNEKEHIPNKEEKKKKTKFNLNLESLNLTSFSFNQNESLMGETSRKIKKMNHFAEKCSDIYKNKLFVSGYKVVQNAKLLEKNKITHVLNLVGDYCPNIHKDKYIYKNFFIRDSKSENIECLFYEIFEFIENCFSQNGKLVVHCIQGVSRSITVVVAFLIFKLRISFNDAFELVKLKRGVASPNIGFIAQLIIFQKRLRNILEPDYFPLIFCAGSHQVEVPKKIVVRHLSEVKFYGRNTNKYICLDPRSIFILISPKLNYIWIGKNCHKSYKNLYQLKINEYYKILVEKEKINENYLIIEQEKEPEEFWEIFKVENIKKKNLYSQNTNWNKWFLNLKEENMIRSARSYKSKICYEEREIVDNKSALFIYPYYLEPLYELDFDDLNKKIFAIICNKKEGKYFLWKGSAFKEPLDERENLSIKEFIRLIIEHYFEIENSDELKKFVEFSGTESDEFLGYFDL